MINGYSIIRHIFSNADSLYINFKLYSIGQKCKLGQWVVSNKRDKYNKCKEVPTRVPNLTITCPYIREVEKPLVSKITELRGKYDIRMVTGIDRAQS